MPTVSVIVTTYNRKEFLAETIRSILNQTYQDFELIVVDNFSNYDFFDLIESFKDNRIRAYQSRNNGVIAVNRNVGIRYAKGEYIAFCDDDDIWMPEKLKLQVNCFNRYNPDLIYSNTIVFFETGLSLISNYPKISNINKLLAGNKITLSSVIVRKDSRLLFKESETLVGIEDYELWIRLMQAGFVFEFISEPLVKNRIIDTSYSQQCKSINEIKNINFTLSLFKSYSTFSLYSKIIILYIITKSILRYLIFLSLKR